MHLRRQRQPRQVLGRAGQRSRVLLGGHDARHAALGQHRGQHAGAGADVEGRQRLQRLQRLQRRQRRVRHQVDVLAAQRREDAVVGVDAVVRRRAQRHHRHALLAPFKGADQAQQLAQRGHRSRAVGRAPGLGAGQPHVGRAAQRDAVVAVERDQDLRQHARALRLRLAVAVKGCARRFDSHRRRRRCRGAAGLAPRHAVGAPRQRQQQQAGVLEVAAPEQPTAFAGQPVGDVSSGGVVGQHHACRWRRGAFAAPARVVGLVVLGPADQGVIGHAARVPCRLGRALQRLSIRPGCSLSHTAGHAAARR